MLKKLLLNLQLFAEGGDGGDGGSAAPTGDNGIENSGEKIPASIPEKAKKYYQKAMEKTNANKPKSAPIDSDPVQSTNEPTTTTEKIPYADLIKSDDYKEEHKAYMDKTISDRLKKYKGIEETSGKQKAILDVVASKYGVNPIKLQTMRFYVDGKLFRIGRLEFMIQDPLPYLPVAYRNKTNGKVIALCRHGWQLDKDGMMQSEGS